LIPLIVNTFRLPDARLSATPIAGLIESID